MGQVKHLGKIITLLVIALFQSGCVTVGLVWNNLNQTDLHNPRVIGWAKADEGKAEEYVIVKYSEGERCVALPLGSRDRPSVFIIPNGDKVGGDSSAFFSTDAMGISRAQGRLVADTVLEYEQFWQAERLKSSPSYRSLSSGFRLSNVDVPADVPNSDTFLGVGFGGRVAVDKLLLTADSPSGAGNTKTRVVLIPMYPKLPSLERGLRTTAAVVLTPLSVAVDVITFPIQIAFFATQHID